MLGCEVRRPPPLLLSTGLNSCWHHGCMGRQALAGTMPARLRRTVLRPRLWLLRGGRTAGLFIRYGRLVLPHDHPHMRSHARNPGFAGKQRASLALSPLGADPHGPSRILQPIRSPDTRTTRCGTAFGRFRTGLGESGAKVFSRYITVHAPHPVLACFRVAKTWTECRPPPPTPPTPIHHPRVARA